MINDGELLRQYSENRSEAAFTELVQRHFNLVYSAALRQVGGDTHRAKDISQSVFTDLARKARALSGRSTVTGWLYIGVHRAAGNAWRAERRRQAREQQALTMEEILRVAEPSPDWEKVRPVLDRALRQLNDDDREAVLLRYFENCAFADIGARLHLTEDAARMRVERALNKLHRVLARCGVTSTALATALAANAVASAPAGMAATVTGAALAGAVGGPGWLVLLMSSTKLQIAAATLLAAGGTTAVLQHRGNDALKKEIAQFEQRIGSIDSTSYAQKIATLTQANRRLANDVAEADNLRENDDLPALHQQAEALAARVEAVRARTALRVAAAQAARARAGFRIAAGQAALGTNVYEQRDLDQKPAAVSQSAHYPAEMRQAGKEGRATIDFIVGPDGAVMDPQVVDSSDDSFGKAAAAVIKQWQYKPGTKGGVPVATYMVVPFTFTMHGPTGKSWF